MPEGIRSEIDAQGYAEGGTIVDLYVNHTGLKLLRDNTTRELSKYFGDLLIEADQVAAQIDADKYDQPTLPGLEDLEN